MLTEVASFLNRKGERDFIGKFVLISHSVADGDFLVHHFLSQALKDGHLVYLVSFAQSFIHYNSIATKLFLHLVLLLPQNVYTLPVTCLSCLHILWGVNLVKHQQEGQLVYVDGLTKLLDGVWSQDAADTSTVVATTCSREPSILTYSLDRDFSLRGLYHLLHQSVVERKEAKPDRPVCLVIDELSVLLSVGVGVREIGDFLRYCQQMFCGPDGLCEGEGYLVAKVFSADECEGEELLRTCLLHHAHLSLHVEGLRTGYSKDVHGELSAEWRNPEQDLVELSRRTTKHAQFKVSDRTVQLFAKGTSKAVL